MFIVITLERWLQWLKVYLKSDTWDPGFLVGPETRDPTGGARDPRLGNLKVDFLKIFSVFSDALRLWMNSCALCVYVYFVCFSLPYLKAHTPLIFYDLNDLIYHLSQFLRKFPPSSCYEIFKLPTKPVIIVRSHIKTMKKI